jgi:4-hydroxy-4-methyl-2-oxoglutarate aldolase
LQSNIGANYGRSVELDDYAPDTGLARLGRLDTCTVSDALDSLGLDGVLTGITPCWPGARVCGRVVTMELAVGPSPTGAPQVHLGVHAISASRPGDVIVIANGGRTAMGSWGGLLSLGAQAAGVAGVVTDGACRDVDEARELGFPVFARAATARTARGRVHEVCCGLPIEIAGVTVRAGDLVLADGSAVLVVSADSAAQVLDLAESIAAREAEMAGRIRAGIPIADVLGPQYEQMTVRRQNPQKRTADEPTQDV